MQLSEIGRLRLKNQQISLQHFKTPAELVAWMGGMQAQDYPAMKWAVGLRLPSTMEAAVEQAVAEKAILRTWCMRGTIHLVAPQEARWLVELTAERVIASAARRHRQLELDEAAFAASQKVFARALEGGKALERQALYALLEKAGISTEGQRGYHMLWHAGLQGLICFGPLSGRQPTFALLEEWAPRAKALPRQEALAELARRYFTSRGPATVNDFVWWSSLVPGEAREAHEAVKSDLLEEVIDGQSYWLPPDTKMPSSSSPDLYLLPGFDEYMLAYKDRSAVLDPGLAPEISPFKNGIFLPIIVVDGRIVGTWKRTLKKNRVEFEANPFADFDEAERHAFAAAAARFGEFLELPAKLSG